MDIFINLTVAGLSTGMMYYLLASGLSLVFGLMGVLNFAHGTIFMYGCYAGVWAYARTGSLIASMAAAIIVGAFFGWIMEKAVISRVYGNHTTQILLTTGLSLVLTELVMIPFGAFILPSAQPASLQGSWVLGDIVLVKYRIFLIVIGAIVAIALNLVIARTKLGMIVRAGVQNPEMVQALGINVKKVFNFVFVLGAALAALGGSLMGPALGAINPEIGNLFMMTGFIVVVVGGMGSFVGTAFAAILVGLASSYTAYVFPEASTAVTVLIMLIVLMIKPTGLFGMGGGN